MKFTHDLHSQRSRLPRSFPRCFSLSLGVCHARLPCHYHTLANILGRLVRASVLPVTTGGQGGAGACLPCSDRSSPGSYEQSGWYRYLPRCTLVHLSHQSCLQSVYGRGVSDKVIQDAALSRALKVARGRCCYGLIPRRLIICNELHQLRRRTVHILTGSFHCSWKSTTFVCRQEAFVGRTSVLKRVYRRYVYPTATAVVTRAAKTILAVFALHHRPWSS